jgi:hypothetical protein
MLIDNITLMSGSEITNARVEAGTTFPVSPLLGQMYYLTTTVSGHDKGLYIFDGTSWQTGDISSITVGSGLTGGGTSGDITIALDTAIMVTPADFTSHITNQALHLTTTENTWIDTLSTTMATNNGVLVTDGSGAPAISTTLPSGLLVDGGGF